MYTYIDDENRDRNRKIDKQEVIKYIWIENHRTFKAVLNKIVNRLDVYDMYDKKIYSVTGLKKPKIRVIEDQMKRKIWNKEFNIGML